MPTLRSSIRSAALAGLAFLTPLGALAATLTPASFTPANGATGINPDTRLTITFSGAVSPATTGLIRIYDAANDAVVETIDLQAGTTQRDTLRATSTVSTRLLPVLNKPIGGIATNFNYYPIVVTNNTVTIYPRNAVLAYGKTYYVKLDAGVFTNPAGDTSAATADNTTWRFSTKSAGPANGTTTLVVAADGSADFCTVQAALDFVPANNTTPTTIQVRNGTYFEQIGFQSKHFITLVGEDVDQTVIEYPNNNTFNNVSGVYHRATMVAQSVHDFTLANLTVRNSTPLNGSQAEAIVINGSSSTLGRNILTRCKFYSYQDTVQLNRQVYVSDSYIEGDVDFLWGSGPAFFENCDIRILRTAGYFTQIRNGNTNHGYVFRHCRFTAPAGITGTYFGRIDPASFPYSEVVLLDSTIGDSTNNAFLSTSTTTSGSNYVAGWWLLNNASSASGTTDLHNWSAGIVDANGATLNDPNNDSFTNMPTDSATLANYRDPAWVLNTTLAGASTSTWTPALVPIWITQPSSRSFSAGETITLTAAALGVPSVTYQWRKDGAAISGATNATLTLSSAGATTAGSYTVVATNSAGSSTSSAAVLTVSGSAAIGAIAKTGYAEAVTGGASGTTVTVNTAAALRTYGESTTPYTIVVSGAIDLGTGGRLKLKSNKTLRGENTSATILGTIEISNAQNVIVSNLNISANTGAAAENDGVTIASSTNVLVTKCTIFDCTDGNLDVINGSDLVTISWCKFYYTRNNGHNFSNLVGSSDTDVGSGNGLTNYRVTWHHNWWSTGAKQRMIACRFGRSHMFNNYWDCAGDDYCTETRNIASILSEYNHYDGVKDPLARRTALPTDLGLLMTNGNLFTSCTGTQLSASDNGFTPPYSYQLYAAADVKSLVKAGAGNVAVDAPVPMSASITGTTAVTAGTTVKLTASPAGFVASSYQWRLNNVAISGATNVNLELPAVTVAQSGAVYTAVLGVGTGPSVVTAPVTLSITVADPNLPAVTEAPVSQTAASGDTVTLSVTASGPGLSYQWKKDGNAIAGATGTSLVLSNVAGSATARYSVTVSNSFGSVTTAGAAVAVLPTKAQIVNLSTRGIAGSDDKALIAGFVVGGTEPKSVLIRAVGPGLTAYGVGGVLADPTLEVFTLQGQRVATNDNWASATNANTVATESARLGAFPLATDGKDAALLTTLNPGGYTAVVKAPAGTSGAALIEIYDASDSATLSRLLNVSLRGDVGDSVLIVGFAVDGRDPKRLLIRAAGPTLAGFGVGGALADPKLEIYRGQQFVSQNDDWGLAPNASDVVAAATATNAFPLAAQSKDAALLITLQPGVYSAVVSGVGAQGVAIVEVYEVP